MNRLTGSWLKLASLIVTGVVIVAAIVDTFRQDSLDPIRMIGWIPAVLVAALYRPRADRRCAHRVRPHSQS